jgi:hypothetical protein
VLIADLSAITRFVSATNQKYKTDYSVDFFSPDNNACYAVPPTWAFGLTESDFTGSPTRWLFPPTTEWIFAALIAACGDKLTVMTGLVVQVSLARMAVSEGSNEVIGPLGSANREIREADRRDRQRRLARLAEPRRLTDRLLGQLEELNLDGVGTVPNGYEPALAELRGHLEDLARVRPRLVERLQSGTRTAELIDTVFTIQEIISPARKPTGTLPFEDPEPTLSV